MSPKSRNNRNLGSVLVLVATINLSLFKDVSVSAFSATPPDNSKHQNQRPSEQSSSYVSKSTASPDLESCFAQGRGIRKQRLDEALTKLGIDPTRMMEASDEFGSAALRAYNSFILPKSDGALAVTEAPSRASVVANNIAFYVREYKSHQEEWLRNHDVALQQFDDKAAPRQSLSIILDNIRSAHNVGNVLRASEAARICHIYLCGMTPCPPHAKVLKTAVGSAEYVPFTKRGSTLELVRELQKKGVTVLGVETTSYSSLIWETQMPQPLALVFGNELVGVETDVLKECDGLVCIPMHGIKNSLNVANCVAIVMWEALRQWNYANEAMKGVASDANKPR